MSRGGMGPAVAIVAITLVGLGIRAWDLAAAGVWFDEAYHVALVREPTVGAMLDAILSNPPSDPMYALVLRGWVAVAGHGDAAIRVPSVIAGTLTIATTAWLARELDGRAGVALLAALFVAVSPYALEFSQEAAPYALAALATTAAIAAAWRWRRTGRVADGALAVVLGIVAAYSHYVVVAVLGLVWLAGSVRRSGPSTVRRRTWLLAGAAILLAWAPWLAGLAEHWLAAAAPRAALSSPFTMIDVLRSAAQYVVGTAALVEGIRPLLIAGLVAGGVLVALGWRAGREPERPGLRVVIATAAVLLIGPAIAAQATGRWLFVAHFGLFTLPSVLVVAAAGAFELRGVLRHRASRVVPALAGTALAGLMLAGVVLFRTEPPHGADGLRELVGRLVSEHRPGEPILVTPAILMPSLRQYTELELTGIPADFDLRNIYTPYARPDPDAVIAAATRNASAGATRLWLVSYDEVHPYEVVGVELSLAFEEGSTFVAEFGTLRLFERRS